MTALKLVTAPTQEPVTTAEAKAHCRVDINDDDALIAAQILTAREAAEKSTWRSYVTQTWDWFLDEWPIDGCFQVPRPPLQSITGIYYTDEDGDETEWASSNYVVDTANEPGRVKIKSNASYPSVSLQELNAIRVRFVAGYGGAEEVPQLAKQYILLLVGDWYENRENSILAAGVTVSLLPTGLESIRRLLSARVY